MAHYGGLLCEDPSDADARRQLKRVADRSGLHAEQVSLLIASAERASDVAQRASLLSQAAELRRDALQDPAGAIELLERVLREGELSQRQAIRVAGELAQLFVQTNRPADRLST